ncbi:hypothetical protein VXM60_01560 [Shewanella khirikhana]|uniref:hypothetical protein n=1 Tax=Shewanella khirikhana TaxID=1965282 RepID=UPI0030CC0F7D
MQLRSFFSIEGCDQGVRTGALGLIAYGGSGLIALLFGSGHYLWGPGIALGLLFALSLVRRCRDAHRPRGYLVAALVPFPLWLLVLAMAGNAALGLICFAIGLALTLLISVLPAKPVKEYQDGYWHPDMPAKTPLPPRREPTLGGDEPAFTHQASASDADAFDSHESGFGRDYEADAPNGAQAIDYPHHENLYGSSHGDEEYPHPDQRSTLNDGFGAPGTVPAARFEQHGASQHEFSRPAEPDFPGTAETGPEGLDIAHASQKSQSQRATADEEGPVWHRFTQRDRLTPNDRADYFNQGADTLMVERSGYLDDERQSHPGLNQHEADTQAATEAATQARPPRTWSDAFNGEGSLEVLMEAIYFHLKRWWRFYLSGAAALLLISAVTAISMRIGVDEPGADTAANGAAPRDSSAGRTELPSGLGLSLDEEVLVLSWDAGSPGRGLIWSLASGEGERHCASLLFNNGNRYRPLEVSARGRMREARFSPLDTQAIVRDIALRGNVQLCGQGFSLKGSQALIEDNPRFAGLLAP